MAQQYRHEKTGVPPRGWRVRTVTQKQHQVRIAFPPGPRKKGSGRVVEILHPLAENAACNRRSMNPILESILGGIAAGASVVTTQKLMERRKKKAKKAANPRAQIEAEMRRLEEGISQGEFRIRSGVDALGKKLTKGILRATAESVERSKAKMRKLRTQLRRSRPNPNDNGAAELYESFHGRSPTEVLTSQEDCVAAGTYAALGKMRGLWLEPPARKNQWGRPHIEFTEADGVKLAAAPGSTQLYLIGGNQQLPVDYLASRGADTTKEFIPLGTVYAISYLTEKSFDGFRSSEYIHELGEETGERPTAFYNKRAKRIILVGGAYSIAPTDNRLGASPGIVN